MLAISLVLLEKMALPFSQLKPKRIGCIFHFTNPARTLLPEFTILLTKRYMLSTSLMTRLLKHQMYFSKNGKAPCSENNNNQLRGTWYINPQKLYFFVIVQAM